VAYFKSLFEKFPDAIEVNYITAESVFGHHSALTCPETSRIQKKNVCVIITMLLDNG
jgi:hypothetical protein